MSTIEELKDTIYKMERESKIAYTKRRELEKQLEKLFVEALIAARVLNKLTWEIQNATRIGCVDGSWYELTKEDQGMINFEDGSDYRVVNLTDKVSLSYDLNDGDLWISSNDTDNLIEFMQSINLHVDNSRLIDRKQSLINQLDDVRKLLNTFGVEE